MAQTQSQISYQTVIHTAALAELDHVPPQERGRLKRRLDECSTYQQPSTHPDARTLRHTEGLFRVRVGDYRALCDLQLPCVRVLLVGHRDGLYDRVEEALERREDA